MPFGTLRVVSRTRKTRDWRGERSLLSGHVESPLCRKIRSFWRRTMASRPHNTNQKNEISELASAKFNEDEVLSRRIGKQDKMIWPLTQAEFLCPIPEVGPVSNQTSRIEGVTILNSYLGHIVNRCSYARGCVWQQLGCASWIKLRSRPLYLKKLKSGEYKIHVRKESHQLPISSLLFETVGPSVRGFMLCITTPSRPHARL